MKKRFIQITLSLLAMSVFSVNTLAADTEYGSFLKRKDVQSFIQKMVTKHQFKESELTQWFMAIRPRPDIIDAISNPAEGTLSWHKYRKIFLIKKRIDGGVSFWKQHRALLERAEKETGVPANIIVAILGVETLYNKYKGRHAVMESLATIGFDYPKRAKFFLGELEQFLLLAREEKVDPLSLKGSYAGAMGGPQFISSSFRHYAVDFDNDGKRDIWNNPADMIGSIANYFKIHGWKKGQAITVNANITGSQFKSVITRKLKPKLSLNELNKIGISSHSPLNEEQKATLIELDQPDKKEYWIGLNNFYVITRYNHSAMYAMAAFQLSEAISQQMKLQQQ